MKTVIIAVLLLSSVAMADKESAKRKVEDCYVHLANLANLNNALIDEIHNTKILCFQLRKDYEIKYGNFYSWNGLN